jgi:hypothetical protein
MNECVGLTNLAVVHDSIFGFEPPLFQKSGMLSKLLSVSKAGFGQRLPGSNPASAGEAKSRQVLNQDREHILALDAMRRRSAQYVCRVMGIIFMWKLVIKLIDFTN